MCHNVLIHHIPIRQPHSPSRFRQTRDFARRSYQLYLHQWSSYCILDNPPNARISRLARFAHILRSIHGSSGSALIPPSGLPLNFTYKGSLATLPCFTPIYPPSLIATCLFRHSCLIRFFRLSISPFSLRTRPSTASSTPRVQTPRYSKVKVCSQSRR